MKLRFRQFNSRAQRRRRRARGSICDSTARFNPTAYGHARLFQKLVGFEVQRLGDTDQAGQRKIVFAAFNATDECPVHVRAFSERFLRQGHFFSIRAHVLCQSLAILVFHARQVWKKKAVANIDVNTIAFNTRQPPCTLAKWHPPIPVKSRELPPGAFHAESDTGRRVFPDCHRNRSNKSGLNGETCGRIFAGKMNLLDSTAGANGGITSRRQTSETVDNIRFKYQLFHLIIAVIPPIRSGVGTQIIHEFNG